MFHCTAGKDRTGVLSAIVLSLLGVDEPTVVADYALSGEAMQRLREKLIAKYPEGRETIENIDEVFSADPAQMELLLDHVREQLRLGRRLRRGLGAGPRTRRGPAGGAARAGGLGPVSRPSSARTSGRNRSTTPASARSSSVMPPESCVREGQAHGVPPDVDVGVVVGRLGGGADGVDEGEGGGEVVQLDRGDQDVALAGPVQVLLLERGVDVGLGEHGLAHGCVISSGRTAASNSSSVR